MPFTLGNKEAIVNMSSKFRAFVDSPAGTAGRLTIEGFGSFEDSKIKNVIAQRYIPGREGYMEIIAPSAAELGVTENNTPVLVHIRVNTTRDNTEWAIDFIKRGRPFIFELVVNPTDTAAQVASKLAEAMAEYELKFHMSDRGLPFSYIVDSGSAAQLNLTLKDPYLSFQLLVDFLAKGQTYGVKASTTRFIHMATVSSVTGSDLVIGSINYGAYKVGDTVKAPSGAETTITAIEATTNTVTVADGSIFTAGDAISVKVEPTEPTFDGKYLEENVRMSLAYTSDSYGISPDEKPLIKGGYTTITWTAVDDNEGGVNRLWKKHKFLGRTRGELGGAREHTYTLYILEGTDMFDATAKVDTILGFLWNSGATDRAMYISDGTSVTTVADFLNNEL